MERWIVMLVAMAIVTVLYPPILGILIGMAFAMGLMLVAYKIFGC